MECLILPQSVLLPLSDVDFEKLKIIQSEEKILRTQVKELIDTNTEIESNDKDYVF